MADELDRASPRQRDEHKGAPDVEKVEETSRILWAVAFSPYEPGGLFDGELVSRWGGSREELTEAVMLNILGGSSCKGSRQKQPNEQGCDGESKPGQSACPLLEEVHHHCKMNVTDDGNRDVTTL